MKVVPIVIGTLGTNIPKKLTDRSKDFGVEIWIAENSVIADGNNSFKSIQNFKETYCH